MPTLAAVGHDLSLITGEPATAFPERAVIRSVKTHLLHGAKSVDVVTPAGAKHRVDVDAVVCAILGEVATRLERTGSVRLDDGRRVRFGCPAVWTAGPRQRLARLAGKVGFDLTVADILDEPIAAGVSWVMGRFARGQAIPRGRVVVFDYGGGTLDVAVLDVRDASPPEITVLSGAGLAEAGDMLDETIARDIAVDLRSAGVDVESHDRAPELHRLLRQAAERLKVQLTVSTTATTDVGGGFDGIPTLRYERTRLESVFTPQLNRAVRMVHACLREANLRHRGSNDTMAVRALSRDVLANSVSYVLLVGGMSRVPAVAARLAGEFSQAVVEADPGVSSPEESVVNGLTFDDVVSDLNLHRPGFDFLIRFVSRDGCDLGSHVVYPAYSPLYEAHQAVAGDFRLGHPATLAIPAGALRAELACIDADGRQLDLHVDDERRRSVDVRTGHRRTLDFKLYVDGRVLVRAAEERILRVERWPVLRSGMATPAIGLRTVDRDEAAPLDPGWWHGGE